MAKDKNETDTIKSGAAVIHVAIRRRNAAESTLDQRDSAAKLAEAVGLAQAINLPVLHQQVFNISRPVPATLLGQGQVENLRSALESVGAGLLVVNAALSPVQQRNLEQALQCKVIDRTGLILEIFGERAQTREGTLQVELAALSYQRSRLVRSWTHLERQRGGFGFMGGPGERQLELDKRMIGARIEKIKAELQDVRRTRGLQRTARQRREQPLVALVGYTNAGKSSLFNALTAADVFAKDLLFATLDPVMRLLTVAPGRVVVLSDTVGFVADLPTHLIDAFRATLEEVENADLILHVRDCAHPDSEAQKQDVQRVLQSLGIEADDTRLVEVLNKIDLLAKPQRHMVAEQTIRREQQGEAVLALSALTGEGVARLLSLIEARAFAAEKEWQVDLPHSNGAALAWLYAHAKVLACDQHEGHLQIKAAGSNVTKARFEKLFGVAEKSA